MLSGQTSGFYQLVTDLLGRRYEHSYMHQILLTDATCGSTTSEEKEKNCKWVGQMLIYRNKVQNSPTKHIFLPILYSLQNHSLPGVPGKQECVIQKLSTGM